MPVKKVKDNAVCPVESYQDVKSTAGLDHVTEHVTTSGKMSSLLITDGARCYLRLAKEFKLKHRFCVHSAGDWNHTAKVKGYGNVEVNTGLVDQMWTDVKRWVPKNITARNKEGDVNNLLWCYVYQWWLRTSISDLTARRQKLYKEWSHQCKWKKRRMSFWPTVLSEPVGIYIHIHIYIYIDLYFHNIFCH